jgi:hypothetical protein
MTLGHQRSRLISFRVSQDEYENVRNACVVLGSRSVSDFARFAVMNAVEETPRLMRPLPVRIGAPDPSVGYLGREIERLARLVEALMQSSTRGPSAPANAEETLAHPTGNQS